MGTAVDQSEPRLELGWAVTAIGIGLLAALVVRWFVFHGGPFHHLSDHLTESAFTGGLAGLVLLGGIWLRTKSGLPTDTYGRIAGWSIGGLFGVGSIVAALLLVSESLALDVFLYYVHFGSSVGATMGLLVGVQEATAIEQARETERNRTLAEQAREEHARLDHLNSVLRHEVLNNANIITGYADLALAADEPVEDHLRTIRHHSENMTSVVKDVRVLIQSLQSPHSFEERNFSTILADEVTSLRTTYPEVDVRTDIPADVSVYCDDLLPRVFGNLLANAVEHNDRPDPRVDMRVDQRDSSVIVRIADNGPGIPESERETLFQRGTSGDHGLGLYLVDGLVARYDGRVELTDTGPDGSTFTVELPTDEATHPSPRDRELVSGTQSSRLARRETDSATTSD